MKRKNTAKKQFEPHIALPYLKEMHEQAMWWINQWSLGYDSEERSFLYVVSGAMGMCPRIRKTTATRLHETYQALLNKPR
jgi:hypothetical protein